MNNICKHFCAGLCDQRIDFTHCEYEHVVAASELLGLEDFGEMSECPNYATFSNEQTKIL